MWFLLVTVLVSEVLALPTRTSIERTPLLSPPCHGNLRYEPRIEGRRRWYGVVSGKADPAIPGVALEVSLDYEAELVGSTFGEVASLGKGEYLIYNSGLKMSKLPQEIRFYVQYGEECDVPIVKEIRLNGDKICLPEDDQEKTSLDSKEVSAYRSGPLENKYVSSFPKIESNVRENEHENPSSKFKTKYRQNHRYLKGAVRGSKRGPLNYDAETISSENHVQITKQPPTATYETLHLEVVTKAFEEKSVDDMESQTRHSVGAVLGTETVIKSNLPYNLISNIQVTLKSRFDATETPEIKTNKKESDENTGISLTQDEFPLNKSSNNDTTFTESFNMLKATVELNNSDSTDITSPKKGNNDSYPADKLKSNSTEIPILTVNEQPSDLSTNNITETVKSSSSSGDMVSSSESTPNKDISPQKTDNLTTTVLETTITHENIENNIQQNGKDLVNDTISPSVNISFGIPNSLNNDNLTVKSKVNLKHQSKEQVKNEIDDETTNIKSSPLNSTSEFGLGDIDADINKLKVQIDALIQLIKPNSNQSKSMNHEISNDINNLTNKTLVDKEETNGTASMNTAAMPYQVNNGTLKDPIMETSTLISTSDQNGSINNETDKSSEDDGQANNKSTTFLDANISNMPDTENSVLTTNNHNVTNNNKQPPDEDGNSNKKLQNRLGTTEIETSSIPTNISEIIATIVKKGMATNEKLDFEKDPINIKRTEFLDNERSNALKSSADIIHNSVMIQLFSADTIAKEAKFIKELASHYKNRATKNITLDPLPIEPKSTESDITKEVFKSSTLSPKTLALAIESILDIVGKKRFPEKIQSKNSKHVPRFETLTVDMKTVPTDEAYGKNIYFDSKKGKTNQENNFSSDKDEENPMIPLIKISEKMLQNEPNDANENSYLDNLKKNPEYTYMKNIHTTQYGQIDDSKPMEESNDVSGEEVVGEYKGKPIYLSSDSVKSKLNNKNSDTGDEEEAGGEEGGVEQKPMHFNVQSGESKPTEEYNNDSDETVLGDKYKDEYSDDSDETIVGDKDEDLFWSSNRNMQSDVANSSSDKPNLNENGINNIVKGEGLNQYQTIRKTLSSRISKDSHTPSLYETLSFEVKTVVPNISNTEILPQENISDSKFISGMNEHRNKANAVSKNTGRGVNYGKSPVNTNGRLEYISSKIENNIPSIIKTELHLGPDTVSSKSNNSAYPRHALRYEAVNVEVKTISPYDATIKSSERIALSNKDLLAELDLNKLKVDVQNLDSELKHYIAPKIDEDRLKRVENMVDKYFGVGNLKDSLNFDMPGSVVVHKCRGRTCQKIRTIVHRHRTRTNDSKP